MADSLNFRASACGAYVVSLIGEAAHVIAWQDALSLVGLYDSLAADFAQQGQHVLAAHERSTANALRLACERAAEIRAAKDGAKRARMVRA